MWRWRAHLSSRLASRGETCGGSWSVASCHFINYWIFANISRFSLTDLNGFLEAWAATCISDSEDVGDYGIGHDERVDLLMNMMIWFQ